MNAKSSLSERTQSSICARTLCGILPVASTFEEEQQQPGMPKTGVIFEVVCFAMSDN